MHGILRPRPTLVGPKPLTAAVDLDALAVQFLGEMRSSARGRFERHRRGSAAPSNLLDGDCRTVERTAATAFREQCSGTLVAHISAHAFSAWVAAEPGYPPQREAHVLAQLQLVLQDLADHGVHECLTLTESQCDVYDLDLAQLVAESLDRTTFSHLRRQADIHWEGTLVKSLDPPVLVMVVSIDL
jgi:hypothetical protein